MEYYVASLSYGKDSIAMLEAIKLLGWPLDRIIHAEIWATDEISADLPPMVEFKSKADAIIKERYGIEVEHICAMCTPDRKYPFTQPPQVGGGEQNSLTTTCSTLSQQEENGSATSTASQKSQLVGVRNSNMKTERLTYQDLFYHIPKRKMKVDGFQRYGGGAEQLQHSREKQYLGFLQVKGNWCTSNLKREALRISNLTQGTISGFPAITQECRGKLKIQPQSLFYADPATGVEE